jgi:hypothetical protein
MIKKKINKILKRKCPECGGKLQSVSCMEDKNGVEFTKVIIECDTCDYYEKHNNNHDHKNDEDW